jgi:hypothetical protein
MTCAECRDALDAFADGELLPEEMESVRAHLGSCAACAERSRGVSELSQLLKSNLVRYPAPDVLKARVRADVSAVASGPSAHPLRAVRATSAWVRMAVVAGFTAVASSLITQGIVRSSAPDSVSDQVFVSHIRSLMPGHLTDVASTAQHEVKRGSTAASILRRRLPKPRFRLGSHCSEGGWTMWTDIRRRSWCTAGGSTSSVYSHGPVAGSDLPAMSSTRNGYHVVHQRQGGIDQWLVSDVNAPSWRTLRGGCGRLGRSGGVGQRWLLANGRRG